MSRERFKELVEADTPGDAFAQVAARYGKRTAIEVHDEPGDVRRAIEAKLKRVRVNPELYLDRINEYRGYLTRMDDNQSHMAAADVVAEAMLDHGDSRVDHPRQCAIIYSGHKDRWIVFGFRFA